MSMTVSFGWWLAPLGVSLAAFTWRWWVHKDDRPSYGYGRIGQGIGELLTFTSALVATLFAWLVWALLA